MEHNFRLVQELYTPSKECPLYSMPNTALSWVRSQSQTNGLPTITPISGSSGVENIQENAVHMSQT